MSKYHPQMYYDAQSLLGTLVPSEEKLQARDTLYKQIREIIRTSTKKEFDVKDMSMGKYAEDVDIAPLDLVIVDRSQPSADTDFSDLPDVYYPSRVASLLQDHGFDGVIQSPDAERRDRISGNRKRGDPPPRTEGSAFRWPLYERSRKSEILYPAVLEATTPERFRLSLPCPTIRHTVKLLELYGRSNPLLRLMISLVYVWMRSWDINEIHPVTLCLLVIRFFQEEEVSRLADEGRPTSISAEHERASSHYTNTAWMPFDAREGPNQPVLLEFSYSLYPQSYPTRDFSVVLSRFLRWIVSKKFHHISTGDDERWPILRIYKGPDLNDGRVADLINTFDVTRLPWSQQQLIVPDPFVPTHNHAFNVHRSTLHYLSVLAEACVSLLQTARPLHTIFGPYYQPEMVVGQRGRSPLPSQIPLSVSRPPIGIRMERQDYFTDLQVRVELTILYETTSASQLVHDNRQRTIARVESSIQRHFGQKYCVEAFGSTQYGVNGPTSDLDLVVIDPDRMTGFAPDVDLRTLPRIYKISEVSIALQRSGFSILQRIPTANVPIVKFKDPYTNIQCDLNINNQLGTINTSLIRHYCDLVPILRPLLHTIKRWARPLGYNSPAGDHGKPITFSSYTLTIMTIGLLQTRGVLPNLQKGSELPEGGTFWLRTRTQERIHCNAWWKKVLDGTPPEMVEIEQALEDWFQYWGYEHDYRNSLISVRWGGVVPRKVPCNRKESETLRDGPFSGFRSSSNTIARNGAGGESSSKSEQSKEKALSETDAKVLEGQNSREEQTLETGANSTEELPLTDASRDEDGDAEDEIDDTGSEAEQDLVALADEEQPSQWQSDVLCVADPFIPSKNLAGAIRPNVVVRFREDCQRVVMRLGAGGNLGALLWFDPRTRPPSPTPQARARRRQQGQEGRTGGRARGGR